MSAVSTAVPTLRVQPRRKSGLTSSPAPQALADQASVIVVAHNSGHLLRDCIASICLTQPEVEVVVVDNASNDGAAERAKAEFPAIHVVHNAHNGGFGAGNNLGAAHAKGEFLVFLNPDAVLTDGWLEALVRPLADDLSVGAVTPKVLLLDDPAHINVAGLNVHLSGVSMCRGLGSHWSAFDERREVAAISGSAFAVRRDVFEAVGGFDEGFFLYVEDVDLSAQVWLAGYRCLYVPHPVVLHDYELEVDARKTFYVERGRYLLLLKTFGLQTLLALSPTLLLVEVITWGWIVLRKPEAALQKLWALWWVVAHRAQIAEKRRRAQTRRMHSDWAFLSHCGWRLDFTQLTSPRLAKVTRAVLNPLLRGAALVARSLLEH